MQCANLPPLSDAYDLLNRSGLDDRSAGKLDRIAMDCAAMQLHTSANMFVRVDPGFRTVVGRVVLGRVVLQAA